MPTNDELRAAAERLRPVDQNAVPCNHIWNAHQQCQWCHRMRRDVDAETLAYHYLTQPQPATDEQIAELKRLCDAATPGPWKAFDVDDDVYMTCIGVTSGEEPDYESKPLAQAVFGDVVCLTLMQSPRCVGHSLNRWSEDARFIAASRNAMPALIARLEQLTAENERLRASIHHAATQLAVAADKRDDAPQSSEAHYREVITGLVMACDRPLGSHYRSDVWEEIRLANTLAQENERLRSRFAAGDRKAEVWECDGRLVVQYFPNDPDNRGRPVSAKELIEWFERLRKDHAFLVEESQCLHWLEDNWACEVVNNDGRTILSDDDGNGIIQCIRQAIAAQRETGNG